MHHLHGMYHPGISHLQVQAHAKFLSPSFFVFRHPLRIAMTTCSLYSSGCILYLPGPFASVIRYHGRKGVWGTAVPGQGISHPRCLRLPAVRVLSGPPQAWGAPIAADALAWEGTSGLDRSASGRQLALCRLRAKMLRCLSQTFGTC